MVVVVTGGAGHIGTNLVATLRAGGDDVRVVDLREPVTGRRLGAEWIRADVRDGVRMRQAFEGAAVVYHLAGVISVAGGMGGLVESVNVDGTRVVAEAALAAGVARLVHCSSVHAYELPARGGGVVDESSPRATGRRLPVYDRSKAAGEAEVRRVVDRGLDAVVVNPTGVIGPRDEAPSRVGTVLLALWRRRLPAVVSGGFDWVDVRDVVAAMRVAADRGRTGENYLLPGHPLAMPDLADLARACSAVAVTRRTAPAWSVRLCAPLATVIATRSHNPLLPTSEALRALRSFPIVDGTKAARELGHQPRPLEETVADLYTFFQSGANNLPSST
jgi:dihydroflavonol-4-reductase